MDGSNKKDDTITVYKEFLEKMQDRLYAGYNTSDTEDEEQSSADADNDDEANGGDKDALALEDAMKDKWFPIR